jgi:hypothetical protein
MNYERIYQQFIADRKAKEADLNASGEYYEKHHIIPRSLGGGDEPENLVALTARDHLYAHYLLVKKYENVDKFAFHKMLHAYHYVFTTKKLTWDEAEAVRIAEMREKRAQMLSEANSGAGNPRFGAVLSEEQKEKIATKLRGKKLKVETREKISKSLKGTRTGKDGPMYGMSGVKSPVADLTVYEWHNVKTGEIRKATRHAMPFSNRQATDYLNSHSQPNRRWPVRFAAGEWYVLGYPYKTHEEARKEYYERGKRRSELNRKYGRRGSNHPGAKKVINLDTGIVYESQRAAADATGALQAKISEVCNGNRKTTAGHRWAYAD